MHTWRADALKFLLRIWHFWKRPSTANSTKPKLLVTFWIQTNLWNTNDSRRFFFAHKLSISVECTSICVDNLIMIPWFEVTMKILAWGIRSRIIGRPNDKAAEAKSFDFKALTSLSKSIKLVQCLQWWRNVLTPLFLKNWPVSLKATFFSWGKRSSLTAMELSPRTLSGDGFEIKRRRKIIGSNYFEKLLQRKSRKAKNQGKNILWRCWSSFKLNSLHNNYVAS